MVSINIERESLFGDEEDEDEMPRFAPLPDLDNDDVNNEHVAENVVPEGDGEGQENLVGVLRDLSKGAAKKRVLKPQPKLDGERLKSAKGLPALPSLFNNVKFKGNGHEAEDLNVVMKGLEHWAHRLFPKLKFDEFIERMERLGQKREVQTCVKRIRMDMAVTESDDLDKRANSDQEDAAAVEMQNQIDAINPAQQNLHQVSYMSSDDEMDMDDASTTLTRPNHSATTLNVENYSAASSLLAAPANPTPEQLERIEKNRRLALERRAAKLGKPIESSNHVTESSVRRDIPLQDSINEEANVRGDATPLDTTSDGNVRGCVLSSDEINKDQ